MFQLGEDPCIQAATRASANVSKADGMMASLFGSFGVPWGRPNQQVLPPEKWANPADLGWYDWWILKKNTSKKKNINQKTLP